MTDTVLIVAAHPDDEVLGCAGTIARHTQVGDRVELCFLAEGITARDANCDLDKRAADIEAREAMCRQSGLLLGVAGFHFHRNPDNRLDAIPLIELAKLVESVVAKVRPTIVYTHHAGDLNIDHQLTQKAVLTACRPLPGFPVRAIYAWENASSTEWAGTSALPFQPNRFVDISSTLDLKLKALDFYGHEMRPFPHARSQEALVNLAKWRGASAGLSAAEAFVVLREIVS